MRLVKDISIRDFEAWGEAEEFYNRLNHRDFDLLDDFFDENYDFIDEVTLNNTLWFKDEYLITEILGEDYDEYYNRKPQVKPL